MFFVCHPKILHKHCLQFLLGVKMAPRETENNAYAKFWGDKQRTLWYVMVFLEWSIRIKIASTTNSNAVVVFHILLCFPFFLACKERSCRSLQRNTIKYFYGIVLVTCVAWYLRPHEVRDRKRHKYHWPIAGDVHFGSRFLPEATKHIFRSVSNCLLDQNWCRPLK